MSIFRVYRNDGHVVIEIFGVKMRFKNPLVNRLRDCCCISKLDYLLKQGTRFPHPVGIVIHKCVIVGKNCSIYQNVTIGGPKLDENNEYQVPKLGNNVTIFPNSCVIGAIEIGDNAIRGAGSVVVKNVPANSMAVGNPARIIKKVEPENE